MSQYPNAARVEEPSKFILRRRAFFIPERHFNSLQLIQRYQMQHITTQHNHHNIIAWLSLRQCTAMYVNVRQCTAMYNTTEYDVWFRAASRRLGIHTDKHSVNPPNWCQPQRFHSVVKFVEELQSCSARVQQTPHCLVSRPICCWSARFGPAQTGSIAASTVQPQ